MTVTPAHDQTVTHHYLVHFPPHPPRTCDPHYVDFNHFHRAHRAAARCHVGERIGFGDCRDEKGVACTIDADGRQSGLELHHAHVEFALQQGISLTALEVDYPGVSNPNDLGAWVETGANFRWLCVFHHRGAGGAHTASHSDWEASQYVNGLIGEASR